jgi:hypothetical protein
MVYAITLKFALANGVYILFTRSLKIFPLTIDSYANEDTKQIVGCETGGPDGQSASLQRLLHEIPTWHRELL